MSNEESFLDDASPQSNSTLRIANSRGMWALAVVILRCAAIGGGLVVIVMIVGTPRGIWYFGHHPQWMVSLESAELVIGPSNTPVNLGAAPVVIPESLLIALPIWLVARCISNYFQLRKAS